MATFTGTVRKNDLEGGFHELVTDKGDVYRLSKCSVKAGARVKIEGNVESGGFGIHMSGPSIAVKSIEVLGQS
ncbi:hypothetical protein OV203_27060 [Nannocystis sp. ILAH1]|uniref:hypothetical protein n=1 Tax=Nannocystis sp. ILAH1 TaxID=2996789 RepID=UPI00226DF2E6|nr:hypothetical protein [Nannocystis sp. ILAH1]MCY0990834.1 hypothetical protein [Nannocystis sp. ILAH1]